MKDVTKIVLFWWLPTVCSIAQNPVNRLTELNGLNGTWDVTTENRLAASGPWESNNGSSIIRMTTQRATLEENFTGTLQNKPIATKSLIAFDHFANRFQNVFIDSEQGVLVDYAGQLTASVFGTDWKSWKAIWMNCFSNASVR